MPQQHISFTFINAAITLTAPAAVVIILNVNISVSITKCNCSRNCSCKCNYKCNYSCNCSCKCNYNCNCSCSCSCICNYNSNCSCSCRYIFQYSYLNLCRYFTVEVCSVQCPVCSVQSLLYISSYTEGKMLRKLSWSIEKGQALCCDVTWPPARTPDIY